jgi:hypothetical protein
VQTEAALAQAFQEVRRASNNHELAPARAALMDCLKSLNVLVSHPVILSLNARVLRPGSSPKSDALLHDLLQQWRAEEQRLGVEIDMRLFAYLASVTEEIKSQVHSILDDVSGEAAADAKRRYAVLYSLLWPRGSAVREKAFDYYNPFAPAAAADPSLLLAELHRQLQFVDVERPDWRTAADEALAQQGLVRLMAGPEARGRLQEALFSLVNRPVETDFLRLHPYIARIERLGEATVATLHLREAVQ